MSKRQRSSTNRPSDPASTASSAPCSQVIRVPGS
jgi:hypothetical protein